MEESVLGSKHAQAVVRESIRSNASLSTAYITMNALATVVAGYGLLSNSAAVVIGAMIIAMLLGPITGIALALVDGDNSLLRKSMAAEAIGVTVVLVVAFAIGYIHRDIPLTAEILSRTKPNLLDLMIALAGGAAGAYATVSPKLSVGLVGVAIATALVPPLATCSICLARGDMRLAVGGFVLFFANLVAIQFASSVVMWLHGFHLLTERTADRRTYIGRISASLVLLITLAIVLGLNFTHSVQREHIEAETRSKLEAGLKAYPGVFLADLRFAPSDTGTQVYAVVRTPYSIAPPEVKLIQAKLPDIDGKRPELHVRSVITKETTTEGYLHEMKKPPADSPDQDSIVSGN